MRYLDTNVIVYAIENHPKYGKKCREILENVEAGKAEACCSVLVLVEIIGVLARINGVLRKKGEKELDVKKNVDALLSLPIHWVDLSPVVIRKAAEYRYPIAGADYVHLVSAELNGVEEVISADRELDKAGSVKRIDPLDYPC
jgi:predicted nucleic acid-binding protein